MQLRRDVGVLTKRVPQRTEMSCGHFCRARTVERLSIPASRLNEQTSKAFHVKHFETSKEEKVSRGKGPLDIEKEMVITKKEERP